LVKPYAALPSGCDINGHLVDFRICEHKIAGICKQECIEAQHRGPLIAIAEDMATGNVAEEVGSFGRECWIYFAAKAFLIRLFSGRSKKIEVKTTCLGYRFDSWPHNCDAKIMRILDECGPKPVDARFTSRQAF